MGATANPVTKQQWLVTLEGLDYYWQSFSGIKDKAETAVYSDGLNYRKYKMVGPREMDAMDLSKAFDPIADAPIVTWYLNYCDRRDGAKTVSVVPVTYCPNVEPIGKTAIIYGCRPIALEGFEIDKTSNDISMLKLSIIGDSWVYQ